MSFLKKMCINSVLFIIDCTVLFAFLPCDAMCCTVLVIVILSVRLSVRLSVTLVDCVHGLCPHGSTYDHNFFTIW